MFCQIGSIINRSVLNPCNFCLLYHQKVLTRLPSKCCSISLRALENKLKLDYDNHNNIIQFTLFIALLDGIFLMSSFSWLNYICIIKKCVINVFRSQNLEADYFKKLISKCDYYSELCVYPLDDKFRNFIWKYHTKVSAINRFKTSNLVGFYFFYIHIMKSSKSWCISIICFILLIFVIT